MMQQKIIAQPSLPQELIDRTIALDNVAAQIRTLVDCCGTYLDSLKAFADRHDGGQYGEWKSLRYLLELIEEKADAVSDVAVAVNAA